MWASEVVFVCCLKTVRAFFISSLFVCAVPGFELRPSHLLGRCSTT
jgi:hypothetical protein